MALDESQNENDIVKDVGDLRFVFEQTLAQKGIAINVDYRENWLGKGFVINTGMSC